MENLSNATHALGLLAQREAVAVRIITIVSLIYLPCSVVSSVFSTDIVKYQGSDGADGKAPGTSFSPVALQRWLEVTIPLTVLTLFLGFIGYQYEKHRQMEDVNKEMKDMGTEASH
ncbi:hypothetical protein DL98DRAFT_522444 [Cadophora sp. DSE1049]|nr:hypothetical protein DL98DRAFT_522444 [Cadophora sp. DSE1049]